MKPILYQLNGALPADRYLPGQNSWPYRVTLRSALLTCQRPATGTLTLTLEIGGVLTGSTVKVAAGTGEDVQNVAIDRTVTAGNFVRWLATGADTVTQLSLTLTVEPTPPVTKPALTVQWVNGRERLTLFNYDVVSHTFTNAESYLAGRATVAQSGAATSFFIGSTEVLRVQSGICFAPGFNTITPATVRNPKLNFCVDNIPIASLTTVDFRLAELVEGVPPDVAADAAGYWERFEFWNGSTLVATLQPEGLTARSIEEAAL